MEAYPNWQRDSVESADSVGSNPTVFTRFREFRFLTLGPARGERKVRTPQSRIQANGLAA